MGCIDDADCRIGHRCADLCVVVQYNSLIFNAVAVVSQRSVMRIHIRSIFGGGLVPAC